MCCEAAKFLTKRWSRPIISDETLVGREKPNQAMERTPPDSFMSVSVVQRLISDRDQIGADHVGTAQGVALCAIRSPAVGLIVRHMKEAGVIPND